MFRCAISGEVSEPREPMIRIVVEEEAVVYDLVDPKKGVIDSRNGREIRKEAGVRLSSIDPEKATRIAAIKAQRPDSEKTRQLAQYRFDHAGKCKKSPDECWMCKSALEWFASLPPGILAKVLEERRVR